MTKVRVEPAILQWAAQRSGSSLDALERRFPQLSDWIKQRAAPTLRQLELLAKATATPLGFFFLPEPPQLALPIPHYRTVDDERVGAPSAELMDTVQQMQRRQAWLREYLVETGHGALPIVSSIDRLQDLAISADRLRAVLAITDDWASRESTWTDALRVLRESMENAGIIVVVNGIVGNNTRRKLDVTEFRGFVLADEHAPLVFVNGVDGKAAQMFTLAHELAHVALGSSAAFDLRAMLPADNPTEIACNRLAAEFLVPEARLRAVWPRLRREDEPFHAAARVFKVSAIVAARKALDVGLISREEFFAFYREYEVDQRRSRRQASGGDFYANQNVRIGRVFGEAVLGATREGRLLFSEAYRLTDLYGRAFDRFMASVGTK